MSVYPHTQIIFRAKRQFYQNNPNVKAADVVTLDGGCIDVVGHNGVLTLDSMRDVSTVALPAQTQGSSSETCSDQNQQEASFGLTSGNPSISDVIIK
jgi:hypothetical protein